MAIFGNFMTGQCDDLEMVLSCIVFLTDGVVLATIKSHLIGEGKNI